MKTASHIFEETMHDFGCEFRKKQNRGLVDETRTAFKRCDHSSLTNNRMGTASLKNETSEVGSKVWDWRVRSIEVA